MLHYLHIGLRIIIMQSHVPTMQQMQTHKAVFDRVKAQKLLSRRSQSEYRMLYLQMFDIIVDRSLVMKENWSCTRSARFFKGKGSSLQLICNAHTAFLLCWAALSKWDKFSWN